MKKDIPILKVEDLILAVAPRMENGTPEADMWDAFIINLKDEPIQNVLINSRGYGEIEGEQMKTTVLRHYFEEIGPRTACKIEPIQTKLFQLTNEYWVSFTYSGYMYDKKY
ncbi:MAG: hypothetical protein D6765_06805, partial [Bacteroidetes bacterium]